MVKDKAQKRSIRTLLKQHLPSVVQSEVFEARGIRFVHKENKLFNYLTKIVYPLGMGILRKSNIR